MRRKGKLPAIGRPCGIQFRSRIVCQPEERAFLHILYINVVIPFVAVPGVRDALAVRGDRRAEFRAEFVGKRSHVKAVIHCPWPRIASQLKK